MFFFKLTRARYLAVISSISALGGLLFGLVTAIIAGAIPFITEEFQLNQVNISMLVSMLLVAAGLGAMSCGSLVDRFGRKMTLFICALLYTLSSLLGAFSPDYQVLLFSRFIAGIALGISSFTIPMYISEIAPQNHRGKFVMLNSMTLTGGMLLAYFINMLFIEQEGWRVMLGVIVVPGSLLCIGTLFLPESPRWLIANNKMSKARSIINKIRCEQTVEGEILAIQQSLVMPKASLNELFKPHILKILGVGFALAIMQQATGINTILYYAPILFKAAGFSGEDLLKIPLLMGGINFVMTGFALLYVDKFGRRSLLNNGLLVMIISLAIIIVLLNSDIQKPYIAPAMLISCILFVGSYAISLGCLFWLLIAEIYPIHIKAKSMGIITAANWFANFIVIFSFLPMLQAWGIQGTFIFYMVACMISLLFTIKYIPETKSVTLETIQANLMAGKKLREIGTAL